MQTLSPLFYLYAVLQQGTRFDLPRGPAERAVYGAKGSIEVNGRFYKEGQMLVFCKDSRAGKKAYREDAVVLCFHQQLKPGLLENCSRLYLASMALLTAYYPQFFTATILDWKPLLMQNKYKDIIVSSLRFLVDEKRVKVFSFIIMPSHLHLIWQIQPGHELEEVQRDFLKYTAQKIRFDLVDNNPELLKQLEVAASDRKYQFWERNTLSIDLYSRDTFIQKLHYIHRNPVHERWRLSKIPEDYYDSSALFYETGVDNFGFLTHYVD